MKKVVTAVMLTGLITLVGCASQAPSPWVGMPYHEADGWKGIGVQAYDARTLRSNGFTPTDAKEWVQVGINSPITIIEWNKAGFTPRTASKWLAKGFTSEKAVSLKAQGLTVE